jgi:hypothetical protein
MRAPAIVLNPTTPSKSLSVPWRADQLHIYNQTPSPVWIRLGSSAPPTSNANADITIPPGDIINLPVSSSEFGFAFANPASVITPIDNIIGVIGDRCTIIASFDEPSVSAASISYTSLALAQGTGQLITTASTVTIGVYDLALWGGLLVQVLGNAGTGALQYELSDDGVNFFFIGSFAVNVNISTTFLFPRTARYIKLSIRYIAFPFSANMTCRIWARPCLQEVLQVQSFNAGGSLLYTINGIAALASDDIFLYAENYGAVRLIMQGNRVFTVQLAFSHDNITYQIVDTVPAQSIGFYFTRIIEQPPRYLRIRTTNTDIVNPLNYTANFQPLDSGSGAEETEKNIVLARAGDIVDIVATNTKLDSIIAQTALRSGMVTLNPQLVIPAALGGTSGIQIPAGYYVYGGNLHSNIAGGAIDYMLIGYGTNVTFSAYWYLTHLTDGAFTVPGSVGFDVGAARHIWLGASVAGPTIRGTLFCAPGP